MSDRDIDILARTLYGEAEANDIDDAEAIAATVMNRVRWRNWPNTPADVCLQPWQFSCWNANDKNLSRIMAVTESDTWFKTCIGIAVRAINGTLVDRTNGATHYYASYLDDRGATPKWARGKTPSYTNTFGRYVHYFFNDIDTPPPVTANDALEQDRPLSETRTVKGGQVAAAGGLLSIIGAAVEQISPAFPLIQTALQYAPWVVGGMVLMGVGMVIWARIDDRAKGMR